MKKITKAFLAVFVCAAMLFLTACGSKAKDYSHGVVSGTDYTSEWLGLKFSLGSDWTLTSDAELAQASQLSDLSDSSTRNALKNGSIVTDFMAIRQNGENINIVVAPGDSTVMSGKKIDENSYFEKLVASLSAAGVKETTVSFLGKTTRAIELNYTDMGIYMIQVPVFVGSNIASITFTSQSQGGVYELMNVCSKI